MSWYFTTMSNLFWINILLAILVVFFGRKDPRSTAFWVMVLAFVPIVGFVLYLMFGHTFRKQKMFALKEKEDRYIKSFVDFQERVMGTGRFQFRNPRSEVHEDMIHMNLRSDEAFYTQNNDVELFFWGEDKFIALLEDIERAQTCIDLQYYIFKPDDIGHRLLSALTRKAKEGVRVRLLFDGVGGRKMRPKTLEAFHAAGGQSAVFFPSLIPGINWRINYRNHRKLAIIDDSIGYIGGFNVGDEYLGKSRRFGPWRDTHLRIRGSSVFSMKYRFLKDWYYVTNDDLSQEAQPLMRGEEPFRGSTGVQIVTSGPDTELTNIKNAMFRMITNAKDRVYIQTPYFIPDDSILLALETAILAGVEVHIMIPGVKDHPFVHWASRAHLGGLIKLGARCYIYRNGFLHAKMVAVDDYVSTVGSSNVDIRSFQLNFEANAFVFDQTINHELIAQFDADRAFCEVLDWELYKNRSFITQVKESFSRLLSPLL